jgi:glucose/arabinose dehydrogenase
MRAAFINSGTGTWAPSGIAFAGDELLLATLSAQILYVTNEDKGSLDPVFSSGERARAVLPYQDGVYVTSTNMSPRATTRSGAADRLLWIQPNR